MKREIMAKKSQLKNGKLYIDNDMTYKERQIQKDKNNCNGGKTKGKNN